MSDPQHPATDTLVDVATSIALLEAIAADRSLLDRLPPEQRERLHAAVGHVYHPDPVLRRRKRKAVARERNAAQVAKEESVLHATGIRELRRRPVFTTPTASTTVSASTNSTSEARNAAIADGPACAQSIRIPRIFGSS